MNVSRVVRLLASPSKLSRASVIRANSTSAPNAAAVPRAVESSDATSVTKQAPNRVAPWSTSQRPRPTAETGARFEQTIMDLQPNPLSAQEMIDNEPIRLIHGRRAACDGGGGPLGHPKVYINLDKPGPRPCGYCGIRFEQAPHHGHGH